MSLYHPTSFVSGKQAAFATGSETSPVQICSRRIKLLFRKINNRAPVQSQECVKGEGNVSGDIILQILRVQN